MNESDSRCSSQPRSQQSDEICSQKASPRLTVEVDIPRRMGGQVIGRDVARLEDIRKSTGVFAYVHGPRGQEGERTYVELRGKAEQITEAVDQLKKVVASTDVECARELKPILVHQSRCGYYETASNKDTAADLEGLFLSSAEGDESGSGSVGGMTAEITIMAKWPLFKCLLGSGGENIDRLRQECVAKIFVQCKKDAYDRQHASIRGSVTDVLYAAEKVKTSLKWYKFARDPKIRDKEGNWLISVEDMRVIRATATMRINEAAHDLLGETAGDNVKAIRGEAGVQSMFVTRKPNREGLFTVDFFGDVGPVMEAMKAVVKLVNRCSPLLPESSSSYIPEEEEGGQSELETLPVLPPPPTASPLAMGLMPDAVHTSLAESDTQLSGCLFQPQASFPQMLSSMSAESANLLQTAQLPEVAQPLQNMSTSSQMPSLPTQPRPLRSITLYTIPSNGLNPDIYLFPSDNGGFFPVLISFQPLFGDPLASDQAASSFTQGPGWGCGLGNSQYQAPQNVPTSPPFYVHGSDGKIYVKQADGSLQPTQIDPIKGSDGKIYIKQADGCLQPVNNC